MKKKKLSWQRWDIKMDNYDYNHKKSNNLPIGRLKNLRDNMAIYGPLNEFGFPEKVDATSASYYTSVLKIRMEAIETICACIRVLGKGWNMDALKKEKTSTLKDISDIIKKAYKRAAENKKTFYLAETEKAKVLAYSIEEMYFDPDKPEEFLDSDEFESAYGEEDHSTVNKRIGSNISKL